MTQLQEILKMQKGLFQGKVNIQDRKNNSVPHHEKGIK